MNIAEENPICSLRFLPMIKGQSNNVLKISGVLIRPDWGVEVILVREMNTPQDGPLGVEQVTLVPVAPESILSKISVGTSTGFLVIPQVKTKLLASSVRSAASVRTWVSRKIRDQAPYEVPQRMISPNNRFGTASACKQYTGLVRREDFMLG